MLNWSACKLNSTKDQQKEEVYKQDSSLQPASRLGALTLDFQPPEL